MIKRLVSVTTHSAAFAGFISLLERAHPLPLAGGERPNLLRVLTYHRVDDLNRPTLYPRVTVTPAAFEQQMRHLAANYRVISMPELLAAHRRGTPLPPRATLITFDDAYCDFATHAWPILQRYNLPVTLFVPTAFPDRPKQVFWWERLYHALHSTAQTELATPLGQRSLATRPLRERVFSQLRDYLKTIPHCEAMAWVERLCDRLEVPPETLAGAGAPGILSWAALLQLAREGVTLGAHTRTHPLMNRIGADEMRTEALGSLWDLRREIGSALPIFAYPSGGFNDEAVRVLDEAGFELAFTTARGINDLRTFDRLRIRRINVGWRTTLPILRAQLLPWMRYLNR